MVARALPANPSLEQLRKQAKQLRDLVRTAHLDADKKARGAREMARELHPRWADVSVADIGWDAFTLADAQLVVARSYGFPSWRRLREHVDVIARHRRSPQRSPANRADLVHELLRLACLTYCSSWNVGAGEEPDD